MALSAGGEAVHGRAYRQHNLSETRRLSPDQEKALAAFSRAPMRVPTTKSNIAGPSKLN